MAVIVAMLRGINVGGHHQIKMDALRALCESLGCKDVCTYVQSGNVVFQSNEPHSDRLRKKIEKAIESAFGFHSEVILRSGAEIRDVVVRNPFGKRRDVEPGKLVITFLGSDPGGEARARLLKIKTNPEELRIDGREVYVHYPNGMGRSKLSAALIEKTLGIPGTGRNWNTVRKLLEMAEKLEG